METTMSISVSDFGVSTNFIIPIDLIIDILSRLPVKSMFRFKSVCKTWYKLIENPSFIKQYFIVSKRDLNYTLSSVLVIDSRTNTIGLQCRDKTENPFAHSCYKFEKFPRIVGILHGFVGVIFDTTEIIIHNPSVGWVRKAPCFSLPDIKTNIFFFGFAFQDHEYKLFRIVYSAYESELIVRAEVYYMSTDKWSEIAVTKGAIDTSHHIKTPLSIISMPVDINDVFYWEAHGCDIPCVVSFDINRYVFDMIACPDELIGYESNRLPFYLDGVKWELVDWKGELALTIFRYSKGFELWVLNEKEKSWTMRFRTEDLPKNDPILGTLGYERNKGLIMQHGSPDFGKELFSYDPESHKTEYLPFEGIKHWQFVKLYTETLLSVSQNNREEDE